MKIVLSTVAALFLLGCSDGSTDAVKETASTHAQEVKTKSQELASEVKEAVVETSSAVQEVAEKKVEKLKAESKEIAKKVETKSTQIAQEVKESTDKARTDIAKAIEPQKVAPKTPKAEEIAEAPVPTAEASIDATALYKSCIACHGVNAEKKALNKSQVIKGWKSSQTVAALQGYKDGSYGGSMKGVMKPQVMKLSDAEIEALAKHIEGL